MGLVAVSELAEVLMCVIVTSSWQEFEPKRNVQSSLDFRKLNKAASKNRVTTAKDLASFKTSQQNVENLRSL